MSLRGAWETGRLGRSWQEVVSADVIVHLDAWAFGSLGHSWEEVSSLYELDPLNPVYYHNDYGP
jgi:hypothetical protein